MMTNPNYYYTIDNLIAHYERLKKKYTFWQWLREEITL